MIFGVVGGVVSERQAAILIEVLLIVKGGHRSVRLLGDYVADAFLQKYSQIDE